MLTLSFEGFKDYVIILSLLGDLAHTRWNYWLPCFTLVINDTLSIYANYINNNKNNCYYH